MYAAIRQAKAKSGSAEELARRIKDGAVPIISDVDGFRAYYVVYAGDDTVTATLAGQIVMEGFLDLRLPSWARRLLTRGIAIVPVIIVTAIYGERGTADLLVFSQVVLSMQLPFAVIPLVRFVSDRRKMGKFAIPPYIAATAWIVAGIIVILNVKLLVDTLVG